jgi:porin
MKRYYILGVVLILFVTNALAQDNESEPLDFEASFLGDVVSNFNGGIKKGQTGLGLIHLSVNFNTENAGFWKGGNFYIHAHKVIGGHPSEQLVGDIQVVSNIDGLTNRFIYELWYSQKFNNFSVLAGLHNLNDVFHVSENASVYLNSSFGISPSLSLNNAISIYPVTTFGGIVRWDNDRFSVLSGVYNFGHAFAAEESFHLKNHVFDDGFFSLFEVQYRVIKNAATKAEFKFGASYKHCSDNHEHFTAECPEKNQYSFYFLTDYLLYNSSTGKSLAAFLQTGYSPHKYSYSPLYFGAGLNFKGLFFSKRSDEIALAFATAQINHYNSIASVYNYFRNESLIEFTYKIPVHKKFNIQPDFQYIFNPAGTDGVHNAFVGLLRTEINF